MDYDKELSIAKTLALEAGDIMLQGVRTLTAVKMI